MVQHELVVFENGAASVRNLIVDEAMHSSIGPEQEADHIHLSQSGLAERLQEPCAEPIVIFDLGLGLATNALLAIELAEKTPGARPLRLLSFENDLQGLELALRNLDAFPFLSRNSEKIRTLLQKNSWRSPSITWELWQGDFSSLDLTGLPQADIIFFDFYSPKAAPTLWSLSIFEKLAKHCSRDAILTTYSAATQIRSALLLAGFAVGKGIGTSMKRETTVAAFRTERLKLPLSTDWLGRFLRSATPLPLDIAMAETRAASSRVVSAPQFARRKPIL